MTHNDFNKYQLSLIDRVLQIGQTKGKEYGSSEDRFANFNRGAAALGLTNIQIAYVYRVLSEPIEGRIVDAIAYLTLIAGMIKEERLND
jgi:hypothetical protein